MRAYTLDWNFSVKKKKFTIIFCLQNSMCKTAILSKLLYHIVKTRGVSILVPVSEMPPILLHNTDFGIGEYASQSTDPIPYNLMVIALTPWHFPVSPK